MPKGRAPPKEALTSQTTHQKSLDQLNTAYPSWYADLKTSEQQEMDDVLMIPIHNPALHATTTFVSYQGTAYVIHLNADKSSLELFSVTEQQLVGSYPMTFNQQIQAYEAAPSNSRNDNEEVCIIVCLRKFSPPITPSRALALIRCILDCSLPPPF